MRGLNAIGVDGGESLRSRVAGHFRRCWTAYLVLAACLAATGVAYTKTQQQVRASQAERFQRGVTKFRDTLELYFSAYINIFNGFAGFIGTVESHTPQVVNEFVEAIGLRQGLPGLVSYGYIDRIPGDGLAQHTETFVRLGYTGFAPVPRSGGPEFYLIAVRDDLDAAGIHGDGTEAGIDPDHRRTMDSARDEARVGITARTKVPVGGVGPGADGFVMYLPIYAGVGIPETVPDRRERLKGFLYGAFAGAQFWGEVYRYAGERQIDFEVYDGLERAPERLQFDSDHDRLEGVPGHKEPPPAYSEAVQLGGLGRTWTFHYATLPAFTQGPEARLPRLALFGGLGLSVALFGLAMVQARGRHRAEVLSESLRDSTAALLAEKERLAVTLRSLGDAVVATDTQGRIAWMNPAAEDYCGYAPSEATGQPLTHVFGLRDRQGQIAIDCPVREVLRTGDTLEPEGAARLLDRQGKPRLVTYCASPIRDPQGVPVGVVIVFRDQTERERLFEEQLKSSKLESVGLLAGGIAHDFNNILTSIMGNVSLATLAATEPEAVRERLAIAARACVRARDLTQQLLTFSRGGAPVRESSPLGDLVSESARFATAGSSVSVQFTADPQLWPAEIDRGQISRVIHNMVLNAVQAMPDGGAVAVAAENLTLDLPSGRELPAGRYVRLAIVDRGTGIRADHLPRIFDPYFTTKETGSGLGLAIAYSIVKRHGGTIQVQSAPNEGTRFEIYLPAADTAPEASASPTVAPGPRGGLILVMDDEPEVLGLTEDMLVSLGYNVVTASDGQNALARFEECVAGARPVTAVILDLTVPGGMGGRETLERLRALHPTLPAVVCSGYSNDPVMADHRGHGFDAVLAKPYTVEALELAVARAVTRESNGASEDSREAAPLRAPARSQT